MAACSAWAFQGWEISGSHGAGRVGFIPALRTHVSTWIASRGYGVGDRNWNGSIQASFLAGGRLISLGSCIYTHTHTSSPRDKIGKSNGAVIASRGVDQWRMPGPHEGTWSSAPVRPRPFAQVGCGSPRLELVC